MAAPILFSFGLPVCNARPIYIYICILYVTSKEPLEVHFPCTKVRGIHQGFRGIHQEVRGIHQVMYPSKL